MTSQHPKTEKPSDTDLKRNPGIGQTTQGVDQEKTTFEDEEGENTIEGDVLNDTEADGSVDPGRRGHTNK